jgi:hypothetical protein
VIIQFEENKGSIFGKCDLVPGSMSISPKKKSKLSSIRENDGQTNSCSIIKLVLDD